MWANVINVMYVTLVLLISLYGLHALIITLLFLLRFRRSSAQEQQLTEWPLVSVQIPLYNERLVAERMIDNVCAIDYPKDRLLIQVLDDSTDQTTEIARARVDHYRSLGFQIVLCHRNNREGFKAGALAKGMQETPAEFIAVFDADFTPPPHFLRRIIPLFACDSRLGMVQARWGHLNRDNNLLTRTQALFLDGHHVVEQVARSRSNLLCNFNGSGGVWRTACVRESGGWQWDTLSEDIDLSFRAQLRGWRLTFLPDLIVPGEIPPTITIFKHQQFRWNFGYAQVFRKLIFRLWTAPNLSLAQRVAGTFQLSAHLTHIFGLLIFLLSVPLALFHPDQPSSLGLLSMASSGPSILFAVSQILGYNDGIKHSIERLIHLPVLVFLTIGTSIYNSYAVISAFAGRKIPFYRTPKYSLTQEKKNSWASLSSTFSVEPSIFFELLMAAYNAVGFSLAIHRAPELMPLTLLGMISFGYVGFSGLLDNIRPKKATRIEVEMAQQ